MLVERIDSYSDKRFPKHILKQHGAFLAEGRPFSVEIISNFEAVISGAPAEYYTAVIEKFRFFAEHISTFYDIHKNIAAQFPRVELFDVKLSDIQPSQFYVDEEKVQMVRNFIRSSSDVIIPLMEYEGRYLSLDGHTRLFTAQQMGINTVKGFLSHSDHSIFDFAREAQHRSIVSPADLQLLSHEDYCILWHQFCDEFFTKRGNPPQENCTESTGK